MIEMLVRAVKRGDGDRLVAVLERDGTGEQPVGRLLVTISRAEAHVVYHELRGERTLPGQTYELMAELVSQLQGKLTAVELIVGEAGKTATGCDFSGRMDARPCRRALARRLRLPCISRCRSW